MKTNNSFNKITIDSAGFSRSKFGLGHDVNTTASIGDTQPLCCRLMVPNSKTTMSMRHLVRMAPMVVPTFGRLKAKTWSSFVGMSDLLPKSFPALLAKAPTAIADLTSNPAVPSALPHMYLSDLSAMVLCGAQWTVYVHDPASTESADDSYTYWKTYDVDNASEASNIIPLQTALSSFVSYGALTGFVGYNGPVLDLSMIVGFGSGTKIPFAAPGAPDATSALRRFFACAYADSANDTRWFEVGLNEADYVLRTHLTVGGSSKELAFAVRLSSFGKRLRKILIGCGYQINFNSSQAVCVLPLLAYYKAYFDSFGLTLYQNWESTAASMLLKSFDAQVNLSNIFVWSGTNGYYFRHFVYDLGTTFVTEPQDYISAHQIQDAVGPQAGTPDMSRGFVNNIVLNSAGQANGLSGIGQSMMTTNTTPDTSTNHVFINRVNHTQVDADLLKILYKWTNRETVAGKRIAELLRAGGFGKYVDECKSNFIGYEELDIDVTDVNATADSTNSVTGHNVVLGEYAGKGVGVTNGNGDSFSFENDEFGYWITMLAITPESGWCQGMDATLLALTADQIYSPDFDAQGMELQPFTTVCGTADWFTMDSSEQTSFTRSFGMVPRHSRYKVAHNVLNGDFNLRGVRDSYQPFTMDKIIQVGDRSCQLTSTAYKYSVQKMLQESDLPVAGLAWRYLNRYQWLNNFERIFTQFDSSSDEFRRLVVELNNAAAYELTYTDYDHFIVMNVLNMVTYAPMLPVADSYGTTDDNDGHGDIKFTKA